MHSDTERSQIAYVTFKDVQGAETAILLDGATIVDKSVSISLAPEYRLPPTAAALPLTSSLDKPPSGAESALRKTEDVVTSMLAKGFILGKDAVAKAKSFDEKHQLTSTASATVASFDQKIGLTEKLSKSTSVVSEKVREVDQKFQVSDKTKSTIEAAGEKLSSAGSSIMKNRYVFTSTAWVAGAFSKVAKAAGEVGQMAKDKVGKAEDEQKRKVVDEFAQVHRTESPEHHPPSKASSAAHAPDSVP
uniref:RRM domain-containing protein n=1 Tax=Kalanchoe fedtschenkoi TaxID=63787 RepID=A0A7N0U4B9_KALFE